MAEVDPPVDVEAAAAEPATPQRAKPEFSLPVLEVVTAAQRQNGLRHNDFQRYRQYCSRRLGRLRKGVHFMHGKSRFQRKTLDVDRVVEDVRFLHLILFQAERAWGYAMQLKQLAETQPRARFHAVARLRKGTQYAKQLAEFAEQEGVCDDRTQLEIQAYVAWFTATTQFELSKWDEAMKLFSQAKHIYENLAKASTPQQAELYNQKCEEINSPLRFCAYNVKGAGADASELRALQNQVKHSNMEVLQSKLDAVLAQTSRQSAEQVTKISWLGHTVPVDKDAYKVAIVEIRRKEADLDEQRTAKAEDVPALLELYDQLFIDYRDTLATIDRDLEKEQANASAVQSQKAEEALVNTQFIKSYVTFLSLQRTVERNRLMLDGALAAFKAGRKPNPDEIVRLYDILGQSLLGYRDIEILEEDGLEIIKFAEAQAAVCKAQRCFYVAESYRLKNQLRKALALYDRARSRAQEARGLLSDSGAEQKATAEETAKLDELNNSVRSQQLDARAAFFLKQHAAEQVESAPDTALADQLDDYVSNPTEHPLVALPPDFKAVPCKPLFWDLAAYHLETPDLSKRVTQQSAVGSVLGALGSWFKS